MTRPRAPKTASGSHAPRAGGMTPVLAMSMVIFSFLVLLALYTLNPNQRKF